MSDRLYVGSSTTPVSGADASITVSGGAKMPPPRRVGRRPWWRYWRRIHDGEGGGRFDKQIYVGSTSNSVGSTSGSVVLKGGLGVAKSVHQASGYSGRLYGGIPGEVRMLDTSSVPNGWRTCDGSTDASYAATDYCYTTPDFRSRLPIGYDTDRDGERSTRGSDTMKGLGGRREFTLAEGDVPSHTHSFTHDHSYSWSHDHTINDHTHMMATRIARVTRLHL